MAMNFLLKRSGTASKRPTAASMALGEIDLNYDASTGGIYYKDSAGAVVKVGPCQVSATAPNVSPAGSAGNSAGEFWYDTANTTLKVWNGTSWVVATSTSGFLPLAGGTMTGNITFNGGQTFPVAGIQSASTTQPGVVQLNDTTTSTSTSQALTANQGKSLQDQITALAVSSNITLGGTFNASTGLVDSVTTQGTAAGLVVGDALPAAASSNNEIFVIIDVQGSTGPSGTPPYHVGDWFLSDGTTWNFLNVGFAPGQATTASQGVVQLATDAEVQAGTDTNNAVVSSSLQSKLSDSTSTTSSTTIASSTAVKAAYDAGAAAQVTADGALQTGGGSMTGNLYISNSELQVDSSAIFTSLGTATFTGTTELNGSTSFFFTPTWLENIGPASQVTYDNTVSGLAAIEVQAAIDEVNGAAGAAQTDATQALTDAASAQSTANAALPLAGGSMTGNIVLTNNAQITTDASTGLELIADLGTNFLLQSTSSGGQIDAQTLSVYANSSDTDALYVYTPGTATIDLGNTNLVTANGLQVNGDAGTAGYILQSNGAAAAPTWVANSADAALPKAGGTMTGNITFNGGQTFPVTGVQDATTGQKGVVQVGSNLSVTAGTISVPLASKTAVGVVQAGTNINVTAGVLSVPAGNRLTPGVLSVGFNLSLSGSQVDVATATTSVAGIVRLNDTTSSTLTTQAATANAVKTAYDAAVAAQATADAAIPDSTFTATGDLLYGTGTGAYSVLPAGTTGQVLTSGGTGAAPTWTTVSGGSLTGITSAVTTALGNNALDSITDPAVLNTAVGISAGTAITTGDQNTLVGYQAGLAVTDGSANVLMGHQAGVALTGTGNVGIGSAAGPTGAASDCVFVGPGAGNIASGNSNVGIGSGAVAKATGNFNTGVGTNAGAEISSGASNTFVGNGAGRTITTGSNNTIIGRYTGGGDPALSNNVIISAGASDIKLVINNTDAVSFGGLTNFGTSGQILMSNGTGAAPTWTSSAALLPSYGSFLSTIPQTNVDTTNGNAVTYNTTNESRNVSVVDGTKLTVAAAGTYNIQISMQVSKTDAGSDIMNFWFKKNGVNIDNSATNLTLQGNNDAQLAALNFVITLAANDYIEIWWWSNDLNVLLLAEPPTAPYPAIPSIIATVVPVGA